MSNRKSTVKSGSQKTVDGRHQQGQSLMELIVVIAVIVFVVGALTFATIASLRNAVFAQNQAQATKLAQEGLERVRVGRDRNEEISTLPDVSDCPNVDSWNGGTAYPIWSCKIYNTCGTGGDCYFNVSSSGALNYLTSSTTFPTAGTESIPPMFNRAIMISDDSTTYSSQKTVTAIVIWRDVSGSHESRLTTILRKI